MDGRYHESWRQSDYCLHLMTKRGSRFSVAYGDETGSSSGNNNSGSNHNSTTSSSNYGVSLLDRKPRSSLFVKLLAFL